MNTKINNKTINQNQLVIEVLRRSRRSLTSEEICNTVNENVKGMKPKTTFTISQISKCLNRFSERNMVIKDNKTGTFSNGRTAIRWGYVKA